MYTNVYRMMSNTTPAMFKCNTVEACERALLTQWHLLRLTAADPLAVLILPVILISEYHVDEHVVVLGVVQTGQADFDHRKHAPETVKT